METLLNFLIQFFRTILVITVQSLVISAIISILRFLLSYISICNVPTWANFLGGAFGIFIFLFVYACYKTIQTLHRYHKDPEFEYQNKTIGISWENYKRFNKQ